MKRLNRMVAFEVGLAVCVGAVAGPKSLLAREVQNEDFVPAVVAGNNGFAVGLYGQLAKQTPDGNLFFSPYSIYSALLMAAEGARAETLAQMADVLHFHEQVRNSANTQSATGQIHTGLAALNKRLTAANRVSDSLRRKVAELEAKLSAANKQVTRLGRGSDFDAIHKAFIETSEKGTEAAAATAVLFPTAEPAELPKMVPFTPTFRADRPFIFLIRDQQSGAIRFLGRITNPKP